MQLKHGWPVATGPSLKTAVSVSLWVLWCDIARQKARRCLRGAPLFHFLGYWSNWETRESSSPLIFSYLQRSISCSVHSDLAVRLQLLLDRAAVYRALLDPEAVATWMVPDGMSSHVHAFDLREGGTFRISLPYDSLTETGKTPAYTDTYHGRFVTLLPDEQVVQVLEFESADPSMQGEMTVTFTLRELAGGTEVLAEHAGVPEGITPERNELGWQISRGKLARFIDVAPRESVARDPLAWLRAAGDARPCTKVEAWQAVDALLIII